MQSAEDLKKTASQVRRDIIRMEQADRNSRAKSRSDTESMEFSVGFLKPSSSAVRFRSMG